LAFTDFDILRRVNLSAMNANSSTAAAIATHFTIEIPVLFAFSIIFI
jgi:hypothetical protein